jgi:hypothetical protein
VATDYSAEIVKQLQHLSSDDQLAILREIDRRSKAPVSRSLLELDGLGCEIWAGIDAQQYVRQERAGAAEQV